MIVAAALPLLAWVVLFHVADAAQTVAAFVLRAYRIATVPLVIYVVAIWAIGLGGGYVVGVRRLRRRAGLAARRPGLLVDGDARRRRWPRSASRGFLGWTLRRERAEAGRGRGRVVLARRQRDHEAAAAAVARLAAHAAAVALGDLLDQRQAEADAAGLLGMARQAEEGLEDALAHRRRHAGAAVADPDRACRRPRAVGARSITVISPPP